MLECLNQEKVIETARKGIAQEIAAAGGNHRLLGRGAAEFKPFNAPERAEAHQSLAAVAQATAYVQNA
jgi:hypothetical protein